MASVSAHCVSCGVNETLMVLLSAYTCSGLEVFAMACRSHCEDGVLLSGWRRVLEVRVR